MKFLTPRNSFNLFIDEKKQNEINNFFIRNKKSNFYFDLREMSQEDDEN